MLREKGLPSGDLYDDVNQFRFGNGALEKSTKSIKLPVGLSGRRGLIDAAVIAGQAPLLLGRPTLEKLNVHMNFQHETVRFMDLPPQEMKVNASGQILIDLMDFPAEKPSTLPEVVDQPKSCQGRKRTKVTLQQKERRCLLAQVKQHEQRKQV